MWIISLPPPPVDSTPMRPPQIKLFNVTAVCEVK
jgi:hypothetical protein